jgi:hypothetical protein
MSTKWSAQVLGKSGTPNFGDLLKDEYTVVLLRGKNSFGDKVYCYVKITRSNADKLEAMLQHTTSFNASDFGLVVAAGTDEPPEELKAEIALNYTLITQPNPVSNQVNNPIPIEKKAWDEY